MAEYKEHLERHIEERRRSLDDDIEELERKAKNAFDWRVQFDEHPGTMLGLAFGAGALVSALFSAPARSRPYPRSEFRGDPDVRDFVSRGSENENSVSRSWENIKGTLLGVALTKLENFVVELIAQRRSQSSVDERSSPSVETIH
jgi:hypothetical protein